MRYGQELGIVVLLAQAYYTDAMTVSSFGYPPPFAARKRFGGGKLLGLSIFLDGTVVNGYRVGRKIGFPTANLRIGDCEKLVPADGVYAVYAFLGVSMRGC